MDDLIVNAYQLGYEEGLSDFGMTFDDNPDSTQSRAYDAGRTVRRVLEGWEDMPNVSAK
jgi:hypothetical protein